MDPQIAIAAIGAIAAIVLGFFKLWADLRQLNHRVNGRLTELLELTRVAATAKGRLAGQEVGQDGLHVAGLVESAEDAGHAHAEKDAGETTLVKRDGGSPPV